MTDGRGRPADREQADASEGGTGAPPEPGAPNRARSDLTREYRGTGVRVQWYASRCIHSAACIRALPEVFDPGRRPWIDIDAAGADEIADAILRCPTGALHFERTDGGPQEPVPEEVEIRAVRNGPYYLRGLVEIYDEVGGLMRRDTRIALCRCGHSAHMPFCDNTHRTLGSRSRESSGQG